jgi:hypothetical protein
MRVGELLSFKNSEFAEFLIGDGLAMKWLTRSRQFSFEESDLETNDESGKR